jgi:quercetin dioxygenase-like cupin family protein
MDLVIGPNLEEALSSEPISMKEGDVKYIPPGTIHRMIATEDVYVIEVSTTELDDVIRHQDDFGRAN